MTNAWPLRWGNPPADSDPIAREWGEWNAPKDLRTIHGEVPPTLPEVMSQPLPPFTKVRAALLRMKGNKPETAIHGVQAMTIVDLFGTKKHGRLLASSEGWKVERA